MDSHDVTPEQAREAMREGEHASEQATRSRTIMRAVLENANRENLTRFLDERVATLGYHDDEALIKAYHTWLSESDNVFDGTGPTWVSTNCEEKLHWLCAREYYREDGERQCDCSCHPENERDAYREHNGENR
jgi:hypothetical protein